jgi:hypothetical protein
MALTACAGEGANDLLAGDENQDATGGFTVLCGLGAEKEELSIGGETLTGCCTENAKLVPNINCTGTSDDSTNVYVEAFAANVVGKMCADYTLDVHY